MQINIASRYYFLQKKLSMNKKRAINVCRESLPVWFIFGFNVKINVEHDAEFT